MVLPGLTNDIAPQDLLSERISDYVFVCAENDKERAESFTIIMDKARDLGVYDTVYEEYQSLAKLHNQARLWEIPKKLKSNMIDAPLPQKCLPNSLWNYMQAVSDYLQVSPEMCILPLLSVLSLCVQGKAVIKHPHNDHTETLNLYTLTIAEPSMRKSPSLSEFMKPVNLYESRFNKLHEEEINAYDRRKKILENKEKKLLNSMKGINEEEVKRVQAELAALTPISKLCMNITDATPEALTQTLLSQGEKMGLLDGEGGVFDTISGVYTNGKANIDVFLKAYGGERCVIVRVSSGQTILEKPLLTMGLMTQPGHFIETLGNKKFTGRGLMHRFMYSFPKKSVCDDFISKNIPKSLKDDYYDMISKLLHIKPPKSNESVPMLQFDDESYKLLHNYSDELIARNNSHYDENIVSWYGKHFGRCIKIAALLHLCEYDMKEPIKADITTKAIKLSKWAETQARKAFGAFEEERENIKAEYVIKYLKKRKKQEISRKELTQRCHMNVDDLKPILELLTVTGYIVTKEEEKVKRRGRPPIIYMVNPYIFES